MDTIAPCTPQVCTPGVVVFDPVGFVASYPAFATVPAAALSMNFSLAELQLNNSCCSVVRDAPTRAYLLDLLTAHITALLNGANGKPATGAVGRVSDATEGSVSASLEYSTEQNGVWYNQTTWGAMYWQATLRFRLARYVPPRRCGTWGGGNYF